MVCRDGRGVMDVVVKGKRRRRLRRRLCVIVADKLLQALVVTNPNGKHGSRPYKGSTRQGQESESLAYPHIHEATNPDPSDLKSR